MSPQAVECPRCREPLFSLEGGATRAPERGRCAFGIGDLHCPLPATVTHAVKGGPVWCTLHAPSAARDTGDREALREIISDPAAAVAAKRKPSTFERAAAANPDLERRDGETDADYHERMRRLAMSLGFERGRPPLAPGANGAREVAPRGQPARQRITSAIVTDYAAFLRSHGFDDRALALLIGGLRPIVEERVGVTSATKGRAA